MESILEQKIVVVNFIQSKLQQTVIHHINQTAITLSCFTTLKGDINV